MADGSTHPIARRETSRDRKKAATAQKILQAAHALFEDVGFEAATIRDIAAKAAMSTGAVFANYEDKVDLYRTIYGHPPISPEAGRELLASLRTVTGPDNGTLATREARRLVNRLGGC